MRGLDRHRDPARGRRAHTVALVVAVLCLGCLSPAAANARGFVEQAGLEIPGKQLFDLGATDYDGDGFLDVFTTNHKFHSSLLHNDGGAGFTDTGGAAGFSQTAEFPGLERLRKPEMGQQGVYLYVTDSGKDKLPGVVHLRSQDATLGGRLIFTGEGLAVESSERADVDVDPGDDSSVVEFDLRPGAVVDIRVKPIDIPFSAEFESPPPPPPPPPVPLPIPQPPLEPEVPVFVGTDAVQAASRQLLLTIRDRHGYAFVDVGGDAGLDVFAVSGGLGGSIGLPGYAGRVQDELLTGSGGTFANASPNSGLIKGDCRGRAAAAVDFDADGLVDLFESCEGQRPQLYRQTSRGSFAQIASPKVVGQTYRWATIGTGSRPELLASVGRRGVQMLQLGEQGWRVLQTIRIDSRNGSVEQFALSDFDRDGDLDVFAVSGSGNTLLRNEGGRLRSVPVERFGIPDRSIAASFVDFDNDGDEDIHLVPQGLMRSTGADRFRRTGQLRSGKANAAVTSWPDLQNDGLRDVIVATGTSTFSKAKRTEVMRNDGPGGHWLEVDLVGTAGNAQAIGARVSVGSGKDRLYQWVGQNDDSHFSQGHYRTYFGLGKRSGADRLVVDWPDGTTTRLDDVAADQVLRVQHP